MNKLECGLKRDQGSRDEEIVEGGKDRGRGARRKLLVAE